MENNNIMSTAWFFRNQVLLLYCFTMAASTLQTQTAEKTSFLITSVNRSQNVDSFTVQCGRNSPCCCEYFGGKSVSGRRWKDGYFLCICRCSTVKPRLSFKASPSCDVEIENPLIDRVKEAHSQVWNAAQQLATSPSGDAIYLQKDLTTKAPVTQGTGSTERPRSENILLIIIVACVVSVAVVIVIAIAICLYQREKKVKLVRERSRIRSRSSQGSTLRRNNQQQGPPAHRYEYVDELSSNGPTKSASLPRTYNPMFDTDTDDCVFVELPSINRGSLAQGLIRPWSVAGCSIQGTGGHGLGEAYNQGYQNLQPMPFGTRGCDSNGKYPHDSTYKAKGCHHVYKPDINRGRSTKSTSAGNIHVIKQSNTGYQQLIYKARELRQRQHSASSPPHFEVPYQSLKASIHRKSDHNEPDNWLPSFEPDYQHLRYKRSLEKSQKRKVRVDSTSDTTNLLTRLSQSESCLIEMVGGTDEKDKSGLRPRSLSVDDIHSVDESPLSPDDLRRNFYQALARLPSNQLESTNREGDYEMGHIYQKCSDPDLYGSDSEGYSSADHLNLPIPEFDGSDSEGYARADLLPGTGDNDYSADSEGYARPDLLTTGSYGQPNELDVSDSEGYTTADFLTTRGFEQPNEHDVSDNEGYARADFLTTRGFEQPNEHDVSDSEGYARADFLTTRGFEQPNEHDVSDSEGYARADSLTRTGHITSTEQDGTDSEGYARVEPSSEVPLLSLDKNANTLERFSKDSDGILGSEDCSKPLLASRISQDKLNMAASGPKTSSGYCSSVVDPFTTSSNSFFEDSREDQCQPNYMTLEETYQEDGAVCSSDRDGVEDGSMKDVCPEYMVLETQPDNDSNVNEASSTWEEADDESGALGCPDYMVLEPNSCR